MAANVGAWVAFVPTLLVTVGIMAVPGLALGLALRLRGWWLVSAAAPLSVSLISVASVVADWVSLPWTIIPVASLTAVAAGAAVAWQLWVGERASASPVRRVDPTHVCASVLAVGVPAGIIGFIVAKGIGEPTRIAQRYDNFFHLNAVQYVLDTGSASPFWVGSMTDPGSLLFYPSGWHAVASLVAQMSGTGVPAASNAVVIVAAALIWPLSAVLLARTLFGASAFVTATTGVLAAATPAFPYLPLHYGPLHPLFLGLVLAPAGIAAAVLALRPHGQTRRHDQVLLLILLIPGIAVAHPGALLAVLALSAPAVAMLGWWLWKRSSAPRYRMLIAGGGAVALVIALGVLHVVRPPASQIYWPPTGSLATAIGEVVTAAVFNYPVATVLAILILVGVVAAVRRPSYMRSNALGMLVVGSVLYVVVAGAANQSLRTWLTGPWYNNPPRLASIWALAAVPVAALGATVLGRWTMRHLERASRFAVTAGKMIPALILMVAVLAVGTQTDEAMRQSAADVNFVYGDGAGTDGPILSAGEYRLLEELDEYVPKDAVVAGDPWTGTSFAYGIAGREVLMPHLLMHESKAAETINTEFATDGDSPKMCEALKKTGVEYILDFDGGPFMENEGGFEGVGNLLRSSYVALVAEEQGARLYKVTSCGGNR